jgi:glycosyltransferase involved in cell wall biosynthesis
VARSEDRVHWLGWVGDDVLRALYDRAAASVQVSLAEGFDLPVLEGMAAGCPLVLSELAVHREVAGACALYAPATDVAQLAARLREAAAWGERPRRERAEEGRSRAAELATLSGIDRYLAVYRRALRA